MQSSTDFNRDFSEFSKSFQSSPAQAREYLLSHPEFYEQCLENISLSGRNAKTMRELDSKAFSYLKSFVMEDGSKELDTKSCKVIEELFHNKLFLSWTDPNGSLDARTLQEKIIKPLLQEKDWTRKHPDFLMRMLIRAIKYLTPEEVVKLFEIVENEKLIDFTMPECNRLLLAAVKIDSVLIVRILLNLKIPLNPFSEKNSDEPLVHAVINQNLEIVRLLFDAGANLDMGYGAMPSLLEFAISGISFNEEIIFELLKRGADPTVLIEPLFKQINKYAPLFTRLLREKAINLRGGFNELICLAIKKGNYSLSWELVKACSASGASLEKVTIETLMNWLDPLFSLDCFELLKNQINKYYLPLFYILAFEHKNYTLAALFFELGEKDQKVPDWMKEYAEALHHGSAAEQGFRRQLNLTNLGHLVGDSFLEKMVTETKEKLEGSTSSSSLRFIIRGITYIADQYDIGLDQVKLNATKRKLENAYLLALDIEDVQRLPASDKKNRLQIIEKQILNNIKTLPIGETLLIPTGWHVKSEGHAVLIECRKAEKGIHMMIINTGEGLKYHKVIEKEIGRHYANTIRHYALSWKDLTSSHILEVILEPDAFGGAISGTDKKSALYSADEFYSFLSPFQVSSKEEIPDDVKLGAGWRHDQLSGTCSMRCILAYMHASLDQSYLPLKDLLKNKAVKFSIQQLGLLAGGDKTIRKCLSLAVPILALQTTKRIRAVSEAEQVVKLEKTVASVEKQKKRLESKLPKIESKHPPLIFNDLANASLFREIDVGRLAGDPFHDWRPDIKRDYYPLNTEKIGNIRDVNALMEHIKQTLKFIKRNGSDARKHLGTLLIEIGRCFVQPNENTLSVIKELKMSPKKCDAVLSEVLNLSQRLFRKTAKMVSENKSQLALHFGLAIGQIVGSLIDDQLGYKDKQRIDHYELYAPAFAIGKTTIDSNILYNPLWNKDWQMLTELFRKGQGEVCFDSKADLIDSALRKEKKNILTLSKGNKDYSLAHAEALRDWSEADRELNEKFAFVEREKKVMEVDKKLWRGHFLWARGLLPSHFNLLRELAFMASAEDVEKKPMSFRKNHLKIRGPYLEVGLSSGKDNKYSVNILYEVDKENINEITGNDGSYKARRKHFRKMKDQGLTNELNYFVEDDSIEFGMKSLAQVAKEQTIMVMRTNISENMIIQFNSDTALKQLARLGFRSKYTLDREPLNGFSTSLIPLLCEEFSKDLVLSMKERSQNIFRTIFFSNALLKLIEEKRVSVDTCFKFFDNNIVFFKEQFVSGVDKVNSVNTYLFLLEQKGRLIAFCKAANLDTGDLLLKFRSEVADILKSPIQNITGARIRSLFMMLESYNVTEISTFEEAKDMIKIQFACTRALDLENPNMYLPETLINMIIDVSLEHKTAIFDIFQREKRAVGNLMNELVKDAGFKNIEEMDWKKEAFPIYGSKSKEDNYFQINVLEGKILVNGVPSHGIPQNIKNHTLFKKVVGENYSPCIMQGLYYEFSDDIGKIRIFASNEFCCHRILNNTWYQLDQYNWIADNALFKDQLFWKPQTDKPHILVTSLQCKEMKYKIESDHKTTILQENENTQYDRIDLSSIPEAAWILEFDSDAILWKGAETRLLLPRCHDEQGNIIEFVKGIPKGMKEERWILKSQPQLFMSEDQTLPNISGKEKFLILENAKGGKTAFVNHKYSIYQDFMEEADEVNLGIYWSYSVEDNELVNLKPEKNALLAYLALINSSTPAEYKIALEYIQKAYKFEKYNPEDIELLKAIYSTNDHSVYADAIRLYAAWLINDNTKRNTGQGIYPILNDYILMQLQKHYLARIRKLPHSMRLENVLSKREMQDWMLEGVQSNKAIIKSIERMNDSFIPRVFNLSALHIQGAPLEERRTDVPMTRPGETLWAQFKGLYDIATMGTKNEKKELQQQLSFLLFDTSTDYPVGNQQAAVTILMAALEHDHTPTDLTNKILPIIDEALSKPINREDELNELLEQYFVEHMIFPQIDITPEPEFEKMIIEPPKPIVLPDKMPPPSKLTFNRSDKLRLDPLKKLFKQSVIEEKSTDFATPPAPFTYKTDDPFIQESITALNNDLIAGTEKNSQSFKYKWVKNASPNDISNLIGQQFHIENQRVKDLETKMLALANEIPKDKKEELTQRAQKISGMRQPITVKECIALFLQADMASFRRLTNLKTEDDIQVLYQLIGDFIEASNCAQRYKAVLDALEGKDIQKIGEEFSLESNIDPARDHQALMVFEYRLNLVLKEHQIRGLRTMTEKDPHSVDPTKLRSILLQRLQGGGKTLVFGHIMALLKADGYHLSIHVPPTAQYATNVEDMSHRSHRVFGQKERTIIFNDQPFRYTEEYLDWIKGTLEEAIVDRQYVTITNESLQSLRCKYLKTKFTALNETDKKCNQKLKQILKLMRSRAIFTLDEVHQGLSARKDLNMPFGEPSHIDINQAKIIQKCIFLAIKSGKLDIANSSKQSDADLIAMKQYIVDQIMLEPEWQAAIIENPAQVRSFITGKSDDLPDFIKPGKIADQIILVRELITDKWLEDCLKTSINEHHGLEDNPKGPRISIPYIANMKPATGSEFSDSCVMIMNTYIAYLGTGLNDMQAKDFIRFSKNEALQEKKDKIDNGETFTIFETHAVLRFKNVLGLDLNELDESNEEDIAKLQKAMLGKTEQTREFLIDFVNARVLKNVELYDKQVCSNGQNTASMAQSIVGYSGSMDNPNLAPLRVDTELEIGTNGQTIHLLITQNSEVTVINDTPEALFSDLILKHPKVQKMRAIIDVGNIFRGVDNQEVAQFIAAKLPKINPQLKGVLFFNASGNLCFMSKDRPANIIQLSGQDADTIEKETGLDKEGIFTYYDQEHITGTDIHQAKDAIAVLTWSEHTQIHEALQGSRRLRGLDDQQRLTHAVSKGAINKIEKVGSPTIKNLILYAHLNEIEVMREDNFMYCIQKIEDAVCQFVLDALYVLDEEAEDQLFHRCSSLFEKNTVINLYLEYAHKRHEMKMEDYLPHVKNQMLNVLTIAGMDGVDLLNKTIDDKIITPSLPTLKPKIAVSANVVSAPLNRETTRVQYREQQKVSEQIKENVNVTQRIDQGQKEKYEFIEEMPLSIYHLRLPTLCDGTQSYSKDCNTNSFETWRLSTTLKLKNINFDDRLFVTKAHAAAFKKGILVKQLDLVGQYHKPVKHLLLIEDTSDNGPTYKLLMCALDEGMTFSSCLEDKNLNLPEGRKMWMLDPSGKRFPYQNQFGDVPDNDTVKLLMTQFLFYNGEFYYLSRKPWCDRLEEWLPKDDSRAHYAALFEQNINNPIGYPRSKACNILHAHDPIHINFKKNLTPNSQRK